MTRLTSCFERLKSEGRKAVIPYVVAGDPSRDGTVPLMHRLVEAGADVVELGVPFRTPCPKGPLSRKATKEHSITA